MSYTIGDTARVSGAFDALDGTATDPTTVTCMIRTPAGVETSYAYGASAVVRDSAGRYHYDVALTAAGRWIYRWKGTGSLVAAGEGFVDVARSGFSAP